MASSAAPLLPMSSSNSSLIGRRQQQPLRPSLAGHTPACLRPRPSVAAAAQQRRRLFGAGSSASSSSDEDDAGASTSRAGSPPPPPPQQQQHRQAAAVRAARAGAPDRQLKEARAARLRRLESEGLLRGDSLIGQTLKQLMAREVVADAADIVSTAPSTLRRQLAEQGLDLEADWAEAEGTLGSAAAKTTTGRAKSLAAKAAAGGVVASELLRLKRPARPHGFVPPALSYEDDDEADDDSWMEILEYDDWVDDVITRKDESPPGSGDPTEAAAAAIRASMHSPEFQAWLRQEEARKAAVEAQAARAAQLERAAAAAGPAAQRMQRRQQAADLAQLQARLQSSQRGLQRPVARPGLLRGRPSQQSTDGSWVSSSEGDTAQGGGSSAPLTPSEMAALLGLNDADVSSSSSSSTRPQGPPVWAPRHGYDSEATAAARRLAAAGAAGQLQSPLLVRPAMRPVAPPGGQQGQQEFWDDEERAAARTRMERAEQHAVIASLLAEATQQQQQAAAPQAAAVAAPTVNEAAVKRLRTAVRDAQLARPSRPGAAPAVPTAGSPTGVQQKQQEQQSASSTTAWDEQEAAELQAAESEAARLALVQQLAEEEMWAWAAGQAAPDEAGSGSRSVSTAPQPPSAAKPAARRASLGLKQPPSRCRGQQQTPHRPEAAAAAAPAAATTQQQPAKPPRQQQQGKKLAGVQPPKAPAAAAAGDQQQQADAVWDEADAAAAAAAAAERERRALLAELEGEADTAELVRWAAEAAAAADSSSRDAQQRLADLSSRVKAPSNLKQRPSRPTPQLQQEQQQPSKQPGKQQRPVRAQSSSKQHVRQPGATAASAGGQQPKQSQQEQAQQASAQEQELERAAAAAAAAMARAEAAAARLAELQSAAAAVTLQRPRFSKAHKPPQQPAAAAAGQLLKPLGQQQQPGRVDGAGKRPRRPAQPLSAPSSSSSSEAVDWRFAEASVAADSAGRT